MSAAAIVAMDRLVVVTREQCALSVSALKFGAAPLEDSLRAGRLAAERRAIVDHITSIDPDLGARVGLVLGALDRDWTAALGRFAELLKPELANFAARADVIKQLRTDLAQIYMEATI
ncbi:MAG: hypothetical protein ACYDAL_14145 [Candidatus Dormibacteraceae bacterium]